MDFITIVSNIALLTFLGILLSFNPMLIVVDLLLVVRSKRPIFNTIMLLAGFGVSVTLLFSLFANLIDPESQISLKKLKEDLDIPSGVELVAGALLIYLAAKKYINEPDEPKVNKTKDFVIPNRPGKIFLFGLVKSTLSLTNIFAILILARQAVVSSWSISTSALAMTWFLIIGFLPLFYIMYLHWFKNESLKKIDQRINKWLSRDTTELATFALAGLGGFFFFKGLIGIL